MSKVDNAKTLTPVAASADDFTMFATAMGVQGVSITIPYKVDLFQRADEVDPLSARVGAVNTYKRVGVLWHARNTDVSGFLLPLQGRLDLRGARAAVLGAGGAARAVVAALGSAGSVVTVYGRNRAKARDVAALADALQRVEHALRRQALVGMACDGAHRRDARALSGVSAST